MEQELQSYANSMVWMTLSDIRRVFGFKSDGFGPTYTSRGLLDQAQVVSVNGAEVDVYGMTLIHYMEIGYIRSKKVGNPDLKFEINADTTHYFHSNIAKRVLTVVGEGDNGLVLGSSDKVEAILQDVHRVGEFLYGFKTETLRSREGLFTLFTQNPIERKVQDYEFGGFQFHPMDRVETALVQYPNIEAGDDALTMNSPNARQMDLKDEEARADEATAALRTAFADSGDLHEDIGNFLEFLLFDDELPRKYRKRAKDLMLRQAVANNQ